MAGLQDGQACFTRGRTWAARAVTPSDSRREQQFFSYYGPFRQMTEYGPVFCDVRNPQAREQHNPKSCPDKILTALCQLGALRMKARRALIFFFDVNHAYIMAEATQTLSLESDSIYEPGDQLWMGYSVIPRDVACCEVTVDLPSLSAQTPHRDSVFIVDDLTQHPYLHSRPYVTGFPNGRYYAGVPITTPSGTNIGAYCILDDKPRVGISEQDLAFMREMSRTVMMHLQTIRALSERVQNSHMVAGLGDFVRGAMDSRHTDDPQHEGLVAKKMRLNEYDETGNFTRMIRPTIPKAFSGEATRPSTEPELETASDYFGQRNAQTQQVSTPGSATTITPMRTPEPSTPLDVLANLTPSPSPRTHSGQRSLGESLAHREAALSKRSKTAKYAVTDDEKTYQRAAESMCQCLSIDGVAFIDMSIDTFGGLAHRIDTTTEESSMNSDLSQEDIAAKAAKAAPPCKLLGCAEAVNDSVKSTSCRPTKMLTQAFLRKLADRNPSGKIWTFREDMMAHDTDGFSTGSESATGSTPTESQTSPLQDRKRARRQRRNDSETLQHAFPGARCIALHGIWDHSRRRWSAVGLYWTFDPFRVLSIETEMHFVAAFTDVIVAETRRLEVLTADKAKSDFISSVSHELRSPLHGILGSVEILKGEKLGNNISKLIEQIEICGYSLLGIIDHLLDFAKLKQQQVKKSSVKRSKIGGDFLPSPDDVSADNLMASKTIISLDDLTEDVVVSSVKSFFHDCITKDPVQTSVILDIDRADNAPYRCQLAAGGWKRIVLNLTTNALKYTPSGYVRVSLKRRAKPGVRRRFDAVLSVTDSGKGMSKEFQKNHLFQDFSQEDTLSDGLGLGLHMVHRIVSDMGGKIKITSDQKGTGTCVTVIVPFEHHPGATAVAEKVNVPLLKTPLENARVGIVTTKQNVTLTRDDRLTAMGWTMAIISIEKNLKNMGLEAEKCCLTDDSTYDLRIVMDIDLELCLQAIRTAPDLDAGRNFAAILVICHDDPTAQALRRTWGNKALNAKVAVDFIALPCGVKQMARAITYILELQTELSTTTDLAGIRLPLQPVTHEGDREHSHTSPPKDLLPLQTSSYPPSLPIRPSLIHLPSNTNPSGPTILQTSNRPVLLLVDDNKINLQLLVAFAKKNNYPHITALDGKLALEAFEHSHRESLASSGSDTAVTGAEVSAGIPNVILMDINMPVMDGYEAVQQIRAYEKKHCMAPAKIIAVTALQSEAAHTEAFGSGFDMFLSKPVKLKNLAKLVQPG